MRKVVCFRKSGHIYEVINNTFIQEVNNVIQCKLINFCVFYESNMNIKSWVGETTSSDVQVQQAASLDGKRSQCASHQRDSAYNYQPIGSKGQGGYDQS